MSRHKKDGQRPMLSAVKHEDGRVEVTGAEHHTAAEVQAVIEAVEQGPPGIYGPLPALSEEMLHTFEQLPPCKVCGKPFGLNDTIDVNRHSHRECKLPDLPRALHHLCKAQVPEAMKGAVRYVVERLVQSPQRRELDLAEIKNMTAALDLGGPANKQAADELRKAAEALG